MEPHSVRYPQLLVPACQDANWKVARSYKSGGHLAPPQRSMILITRGWYHLRESPYHKDLRIAPTKEVQVPPSPFQDHMVVNIDRKTVA
jgi:hypothetical protein